MAQTSRQFELRQLLKAYRKGLISDELFEEQLREVDERDPLGAESDEAVAAPEPARVWTCGSRQFETEHAMVVHFLDEFRAGEAFGAEAFALWADASSDPCLRGGLRTVCGREDAHARLLAARLAELGATPKVELPAHFREATRTRLRSREIADSEKVRDFLARLPEGAEALRPITVVLEQIERDVETRALLEEIVVDEAATIRWFEESAVRLGVTRSSATAGANGHAAPAGAEPA